MFLLAHVNFFALKLSRIKECAEGDTEGQRGSTGVFRLAAHVTIAECGQPDYLSSSRQTWELGGRPPPHNNDTCRWATT